MSQGNGVISSSDLMKKLVQAKKVMNKVDGGDYERGNINEAALLSSPEEIINQPVEYSQPTQHKQSVVDKNRIENSKLPDAIKRAMMENPIPQISLSDNLDMDFVKGAKRLMEQEGLGKKQPPKQQPTFQQPQTMDMNALSLMIENTVRKVLDEKLNQILIAQETKSINENLVLKVGDSIFKGKITGVNSSK
jgi:hypothetical protein